MHFSSNRRRLLHGLSLAPLGWSSASIAAASEEWIMPDEGDPHLGTWMSFGPSEKIWGEELLPIVRKNLAGIANAIVEFEPVHMLVRQEDCQVATQLCSSKVELHEQPVDDLWMRDTGSVFVKNRYAAGKWAGIDFNFNGWGNKQAHADDAKVARFVTRQTGVQYVKSGLVLEGGGIEVDGQGTGIITESCVLNCNRNPGVSKATAELELKRVLGLKKIIWLPGIAGRDITDGHTDFYARFIKEGVVVVGVDDDPGSYDHKVTLDHLRILRQATDVSGRKLEVHELHAPDTTKIRQGLYAKNQKTFAAGYINFYVCNGGIISPQFGDASADANALALLKMLFPTRKVKQLNIDAIAAGGGGIHCTTQQQPR